MPLRAVLLLVPLLLSGCTHAVRTAPDRDAKIREFVAAPVVLMFAPFIAEEDRTAAITAAETTEFISAIGDDLKKIKVSAERRLTQGSKLLIPGSRVDLSEGNWILWERTY